LSTTEIDNDSAEQAEAEATPAPERPRAEWGDLGLDPEVLSAVEARGYEYPTPVQAKSVPAALEGRDLLVRAKTGTGKTAAFMLPIIQRIPAGYGKAGCIVLCPVRELAIQIAEETELLAKDKNLRVVTLYGGVGIGPQADALNDGYEIVIGTPGRVMDHIKRGNLKLGDAIVSALDEADEMLSMGFFVEVTGILEHLPKTAQTLLFSATMEKRLKELIGKYLKDPHEIYLSLDTDRVADTIHHILYETTIEYPKPRQLLHILDTEKPTSALIFCNTKADTEMVSRFLNKQGVATEPISSDLTQKARERVMKRIKRGELDYLAATDVAARGIDIENLSHVIHYSLPEDPAIYLHRTGRTGRAGKKGTAISIMSAAEMNCRKILVQEYDIDFEVRELPSREEVDSARAERLLQELKGTLAAGLPFEAFLPLARKLREGGAKSDMLIAVALRGFFRWHRMEARRAELEAGGEDPDAVEALMAARTGRGARRDGGRDGGRGRGPRRDGPRREGGRDGGRDGGRGRRPEGRSENRSENRSGARSEPRNDDRPKQTEGGSERPPRRRRRRKNRTESSTKSE
jgi:ATP-dependent RNA helicase DeaD